MGEAAKRRRLARPREVQATGELTDVLSAEAKVEPPAPAQPGAGETPTTYSREPADRAFYVTLKSLIEVRIEMLASKTKDEAALIDGLGDVLGDISLAFDDGMASAQVGHIGLINAYLLSWALAGVGRYRIGYVSNAFAPGTMNPGAANAIRAVVDEIQRESALRLSVGARAVVRVALEDVRQRLEASAEQGPLAEAAGNA